MGRAPNTTKDNRRDTMNSNAIVSDIISGAPGFIGTMRIERVLEVVEELKLNEFFDSDNMVGAADAVRREINHRLWAESAVVSMNDVMAYLITRYVDVLEALEQLKDRLGRCGYDMGTSRGKDVLNSALTAWAIGLHYEDNEDEYEEAKKPEPKQVTVRVMVEVYVDGRLVEDCEVVEADAEYRGPDDEDFDDALNYDLCRLDSEVADLVARALED